VLILDEFHLLSAEAAAKLLKTIEEPPDSTVFIVLADHMPPELVTIASRCVRIDFVAVPDDVVIATLIAEGVNPTHAAQCAQAAAGDLSRARLLASDSHLAARRELFAGMPYRLDGTASAVVAAVGQITDAIEGAAAPLAQRHAHEVTALEARISAMGERGSGKKTLEDRHKRELRRHRTDELRSGLITLAGAYRDALVDGTLHRPESAATAITRIHASLEALERNPNEQLLLQALLLGLPSMTR
jgi:DNA polymerase-3 subunit delta'